MKTSTFTFLSCVVLGSTLQAQKLTILPQVGLENLVTKVDYNNLSAFKPLQSLPTPTLGVRMDYKVKKVVGVFAGLSTSRPTVAYSFTNPETGMNAYTAAAGDLQLQLQGGLQATTNLFIFPNLQEQPNQLQLRAHGPATEGVELTDQWAIAARGIKHKLANLLKIKVGLFA